MRKPTTPKTAARHAIARAVELLDSIALTVAETKRQFTIAEAIDGRPSAPDWQAIANANARALQAAREERDEARDALAAAECERDALRRELGEVTRLASDPASKRAFMADRAGIDAPSEGRRAIMQPANHRTAAARADRIAGPIAEACRELAAETRGAAPWHGVADPRPAMAAASLAMLRELAAGEWEPDNTGADWVKDAEDDERADTERLARILGVTPTEASRAWVAYSESVFAGWIAPPASDDEFAAMARPFLRT